MRKGFSLWILPELWVQVKNHCSSNRMSISEAVEQYCSKLLITSWDIPFQVNRQIHSYILKKQFGEEFPLERKRITLNKDLIEKLTVLIRVKLIESYGSDDFLSTANVVTLILFLFCREYHLPIESLNYFSDEYFKNNYVLSVQRIFEKIDLLYQRLGHLPTSRDYAGEGGGASLSYLKSYFGTYSKALSSYSTQQELISRKYDV